MAASPIEFTLIIVALALFFFLATLCQVGRSIHRKRRKLPPDFRGPLSAWLWLLAGGPEPLPKTSPVHCQCKKCSAARRFLVPLVHVCCPTAIFVLFTVGGLFLTWMSLVKTKYTLDIDLDISSFLEADSEVYYTETAVDTAVANQEAMVSELKSLYSRRLATQSNALWHIDFFYGVKNGADSIFTAEALAEIARFEEAFRNYPGWEDVCLWSSGGTICHGGDTVIDVFYKTVTTSDSGHIVTTYDGQGVLQDIDDTLTDMLEKGITWWCDKDFSASNLKSQYTRARFLGGSVGTEKAKAWLIDIYENLLTKVNTEDGGYEYITLSWYEKKWLFDREILQTLLHDGLWSAGSFLFVFIFLLLKLRSVALACLAMFSIILSFGTTYYLYVCVAEFEKMTLLNFVSLFLVTGIAVDDILVLWTLYRQAEGEYGYRLTPRQKLQVSYSHATSAMLVTTFTTAGSFYSLTASTLPILRSFGFFMGTVVAVNYLNVITIFPAALLMNQLMSAWCMRRCCCCCMRSKKKPNTHADEGVPLNADDAKGERPSISNEPTAADAPMPPTASDPLDPNPPVPVGTITNSAVGPPTGSGGSAEASGRSHPEDSAAAPPTPSGRSGGLGGLALGSGGSGELRLASPPSTSMRSALSAQKKKFKQKTASLLGMDEETSVVVKGEMIRTKFYRAVYRIRYLLIIVLLALAFTAGWMAIADLTMASNQPLIFSEDTNLGRLQTLRTDVFSSYDSSDLVAERAAYSSTSSTVENTCPGALVVDGLTVECSGHGTCETTLYVCICESGYTGAGCSDIDRPAILSLTPYGIEATTVADETTLAVSESADPLTYEVTLYNFGDVESTWYLTWNVSWITCSPSAGTTSTRDALTLSPDTTTITVSVDLAGKPSAFAEVGIATLTAGSSEAILLHGSLADDIEDFEGEPTSSLRAFAGNMTDPPIGVQAIVLDSLFLNAMSVTSGATMSTSFSQVRSHYSAAAPYSISSIRVYAEFEFPTVEVRFVVDGNEETISENGWSSYYDLEVETALKVQVFAVGDETAGVSDREYSVTFTRAALRTPGAPTLNRVLASPGALEVYFEPPTDNGGAEVSSYAATATVTSTGRRLQVGTSVSTSGACSSTACWSDGAFASGNGCCVLTISGLDDSSAYSVSVVAENDAGSSSTSVPILSEDNTDWKPVSPGGSSSAPALLEAPTVTQVGDGYVILSFVSTDVSVGSAVPVETFTCTSSPGSITGESSDASAIRIDGLRADVAYSFSCTCSNAQDDTTISTSDVSESSETIYPTIPDPVAPTIRLTRISDGSITGTISVEDIFADRFECSFGLSPDGPFEDSTYSLSSSKTEAALSFSDLDSTLAYLLTCEFVNSAESRDPVEMTSSSTVVTILAVPDAPEFTLTSLSGALEASVSDWTSEEENNCTATWEGDVSEVVSEATSATSTVLVTGLTDGLRYLVACRSVLQLDGNGGEVIGPYADASAATMVGTTSGAPTILSVDKSTEGQITVTVEAVTHVPEVESYTCSFEIGDSSNGQNSVNAIDGQTSYEVVLDLAGADIDAGATIECWTTNGLGDSVSSSRIIHAVTTVTSSTISTTTTSTATSTTTTVTTSTSTTATFTMSSTMTTTTTFFTTATQTQTTVTATTTTATTTTTTTTTVTSTTSTTTVSTTSKVTTTVTFLEGQTTATRTTTSITETSTTKTSTTKTSTTKTSTTKTSSTLTTTSFTSTTTTKTPATITGSWELTTDGYDLTSAEGQQALINAISAMTGIPAEYITIDFGSGRRLTASYQVNFNIQVPDGYNEEDVQTSLDSGDEVAAVNQALQDSGASGGVLPPTTTSRETSTTVLTTIITSTTEMTTTTILTTTTLPEVTTTILPTTTAPEPTTTPDPTTTTLPETTTETTTTTTTESTTTTTTTEVTSTTTSSTTVTSTVTTVTATTTSVTLTTTTVSTSSTVTTETTTSTKRYFMGIDSVVATGSGVLTIYAAAPAERVGMAVVCEAVLRGCDSDLECSPTADEGTCSSASVGNSGSEQWTVTLAEIPYAEAPFALPDLSSISVGKSVTARCHTYGETGLAENWTDWSCPVTVFSVPSSPTAPTLAVSGPLELTATLSTSLTEAEAGYTTLTRAICTDSLNEVHTFNIGSQDEVTFTMTGLTAGSEHSVSCVLVNAFGSSAASVSDSVTAVSYAVTPKVSCAQLGNGTITLNFETPSSNTTAPIEGYSCGLTSVGEKETTFDSMVFSGLTNGEAYQVQCYSMGSFGMDSDVIFVEELIPGIPLLAAYDVSGTDVESVTVTELRTHMASAWSVSAGRIVADLYGDDETVSSCMPVTTAATAAEAVAGGRRLSRKRSLQTTTHTNLQVRISTMGDSDPGLSTYVTDLNALATSTSFAALFGDDGGVSQTSQPTIASKNFVDSALSFLAVANNRGSAMPLVPTFDPAILAYQVNVSSTTTAVYATARSSMAYPPTLTGDAESPAEYTLTSVWPEYRVISVEVVAMDMSTTTYNLQVSFIGDDCASSCNNGTCNRLTGSCECEAHYYGSTCLAYCPGEEEACSGHGSCSVSQSGCICDDSYTGDDCTTRTCPTCENNGTCVEGAQSVNSTWTCSCPDGYFGDDCTQFLCPSNCSNAGTCNYYTGVCSCYPGYDGDDCSEEPETLISLSSCIQLHLVWGIQGYSEENHSNPVFEPAFNMSSDESQNWLIQVHEELRANSVLRVRDDQDAWFEVFMAEKGSSNFPAGGKFVPWVQDFFDYPTEADHVSSYGGDVGFTTAAFEGNLIYVRSRIRIDLSTNLAAAELEDDYEAWKAAIEEINSRAPTGMKMLMASDNWSMVDLELGIMRSTILAMSLAVSVSLVSVFVFTGNIILAVLTIFSTGLVILLLSGFLLSWIGWELGAVQAIGLTTFVGMGVDYALHLSHGFHTAECEKRDAKTILALERIGGAIFLAGLTTAGSMIFLFPCQIIFFYQLGVMLISNTVISVFYAFFFLAPLLMVMGPTGHWGDIVYPIRLLLGKVPQAGELAKETSEDSAKSPASRVVPIDEENPQVSSPPPAPHEEAPGTDGVSGLLPLPEGWVRLWDDQLKVFVYKNEARELVTTLHPAQQEDGCVHVA